MVRKLVLSIFSTWSPVLCSCVTTAGLIQMTSCWFTFRRWENTSKMTRQKCKLLRVIVGGSSWIDGNLPCFFERGKASLRKSGIRSTMPWRSRRSSIANCETWSIARCLCLGVNDSFPWVCTGWMADSPSFWDKTWGNWIKPWNWHLFQGEYGWDTSEGFG